MKHLTNEEENFIKDLVAFMIRNDVVIARNGDDHDRFLIIDNKDKINLYIDELYDYNVGAEYYY
jgi:hypothetical protein